MVEGGERHSGADPQALGPSGGEGAHHVHGGTDAEAGEMMLGQPDRVVAGTVHDLDALNRTIVDCGKSDLPFGQ